MKSLSVVAIVALSGCVHVPTCGNLESARVVFNEPSRCEVRIRQVTLGQDLNLPKALSANLSSMKLDWVAASAVDDGSIQLGHFVLLPGGLQ